jgi:hypothetical protein
VELLAPKHHGENHGDRENFDQESIVLAICRLTKRRDELRNVVVLKIIQ